jgi:hypothetical protein
MAVHPLAERIPQLAESAFSAVDAFRGKIRDIRSDKRFSDQGHLEKIRDAAKNPLAYLGELRAQLEGERGSLDKRRARFSLPVPKKDDVVGALDRADRAVIRFTRLAARIK